VARERIINDRLMMLVVGDLDVVAPGLREIGTQVCVVYYEGREV